MLQLVQWLINGAAKNRVAKVVQRKILLKRISATMVAARVLSMIGCYDYIIPQITPMRYPGCQHFIQEKAGVIHFLAIMKKTMPHAV